jgi:hypothetical protein
LCIQLTRQKSYVAEVPSRSRRTSSRSTISCTTSKWRSSTRPKRTRVITPSRPSEQIVAGKRGSSRPMPCTVALPVDGSTVASSTHSSSSYSEFSELAGAVPVEIRPASV